MRSTRPAGTCASSGRADSGFSPTGPTTSTSPRPTGDSSGRPSNGRARPAKKKRLSKPTDVLPIQKHVSKGGGKALDPCFATGYKALIRREADLKHGLVAARMT